MSGSLSTFVQPMLADEVREFLASRLEVLTEGDGAGTAIVNLPAIGRQTFFLPREVMALPVEQRRIAIGALLEDACTRRAARCHLARLRCGRHMKTHVSC